MLDENMTPYLIDFGLCEMLKKNDSQLLMDWVGTQEYVAPQILTHTPYDGAKVDVWSLGVILYLLLVVEFPFEPQQRNDHIVKTGKHPLVQFPNNTPLSPEAKDLISKMLNPNEHQRLTFKQVLQHRWMRAQL
jgi:protein-serine/threonine kinase